MTTSQQSSTADPYQVARAIALRQLDRAPRTRWQLEQALAKRLVPVEVAGAVLDRLAEVGLIDDQAYAEMLVRSRTVTKGLARRALRAELRAKGCDDEVIACVLGQVSEADEVENARALIARRAPRLAGIDVKVRNRRLAGWLMRKGYSGNVIGSVLAELD